MIKQLFGHVLPVLYCSTPKLKIIIISLCIILEKYIQLFNITFYYNEELYEFISIV